jgi:hypothetical protein
MEGDSSSSSHPAVAAVLVVVVHCSIIRILQYRHDSCPIGLPPVRRTTIVVVEPSSPLRIKKPDCKSAGKMAFFPPLGVATFSVLRRLGWFLVVD